MYYGLEKYSLGLIVEITTIHFERPGFLKNLEKNPNSAWSGYRTEETA